VVLEEQLHAERLVARDAQPCRLDLLETYNQAWNQGAQIDARTFMGRPILEAITIYSEGMAEIFFGDDDMFWGHSIIVSMNESGEFDSAYIGG